MTKTKRLILVGCGKSKAEKASAARELYTGNLFKAARDYAEAEVAAGRADGWAILSGLHRVVAPDRVLEPYNFKLSHLGNADDPMWGRVSLNAVHAMAPGADVELVVLAGVDYVAELERHLATNDGIRIVTPLAGLQVGERLAWFKQERELSARRAASEAASERIAADTIAGRKAIAAKEKPLRSWKEEAVEVPCPVCHAKAGSWCKSPSGHRAMRLHADRVKGLDEARELAHRAAAKKAPTTYVGTSHDQELRACPVCVGSAAGLPMCFAPTGKGSRWTSLDAGIYHTARVPAAVLEALPRENEEARERCNQAIAEARARLGMTDPELNPASPCARCGEPTIRGVNSDFCSLACEEAAAAAESVRADLARIRAARKADERGLREHAMEQADRAAAARAAALEPVGMLVDDSEELVLEGVLPEPRRAAGWGTIQLDLFQRSLCEAPVQITLA